VELAPIREATSAEVATALLTAWITSHGTPRAIVTDGGSHFQGLFASVCDELRVKHHVDIPYHPLGHGTVERAIGIAQSVLRTTLRDQPAWSSSLPFVRFAMNSRMNRTIGLSAFEVMYGVCPRLPLYNSLETPFPAVFPDNNPIDFARRLARGDFLSTVRKHEALAHQEAIKTLKSDAREFMAGDYVLRKAPKRNHALEPAWWGPFLVESVLSPTDVVLRDLLTDDTINAHVDQLVLFIPDPQTDLRAEALRPDEFLVDDILAHQRDGANELWLRVRWTGFDEYPPEDRRGWERAELLKNLDVVKAYLKKHRLRV